MEKDEPEKSKLFLSQVALNNQEKEQKIKSTINPSIYKVKSKSVKNYFRSAFFFLVCLDLFNKYLFYS